MGENGEVELPSSPEDFKKISRKVVTLPASGLKVEIRKLTGLDFLSTLGTLPLVAPGEDTEQRTKRVTKEMTENPDTARQSTIMVISRGISRPRVVDVASADCPKDAILISDLGRDLDWLAMEILTFSGLTEGSARVAGKFPEGSGVRAS